MLASRFCCSLGQCRMSPFRLDFRAPSHVADEAAQLASEAADAAAAQPAGKAAGETSPQRVRLTGTVRYSTPLRVGETLRLEVDLPQGANALVRWKRASSYDGEYSYIEGATGCEYVLAEEDLGCYIACRVDAVGYGYLFDGIDEKIAYPVVGADFGIDSADSLTSGVMVFVCDSAAASWYHACDCDYLSRRRHKGYGIYELSLEEAKRSYAACPYCEVG